MGANLLRNFWRSKGVNSFLISGSDQFGQKIYGSSLNEGVSPQEYASKWHREHLQTFKNLKVENDFYGFTSSEHHKSFVRNFLEILKKEEDFFRSEREELFLRIGAWEGFLKLFLKGSGLKEKIIRRCFPLEREKDVLRKIPWGVPTGKPGEVYYVWIEALLGYFSFLKEKLPSFEGELELCFSFGIDNLYFHAIILPILIRGLKKHLKLRIKKISYLVQQHVILQGGAKMSKSAGNAINLNELLKEFTPREIKFVALSLMNADKPRVFSREILLNRVTRLRRVDKKLEGIPEENGPWDELDSAIEAGEFKKIFKLLEFSEATKKKISLGRLKYYLNKIILY